MKKSSRAVLAVGAAVVVLTGGAGSLAYWNATASVDGGSIDSGRLSLNPVPGATWQLNGATVANPSAVVLVPGDVLTYNGEYTIDAEGDNLQASVAVAGATESGTLASYVDTTLRYTVDGEASTTTIDSGDDGAVLAVELEIDFGFGTAVDNASQAKRIDLTDVSVVLEQTDATP